MPTAFEARDNGVLLSFSDKLDASASTAAAHFAQCWNYRYSAAYGSPELSLREAGKPGHDVLQIASAHVLPDGRLFLEIPQLQPAQQIHIVVKPKADVQRELFLTAHNLGAPFTGFPGYKVIAKSHGAHGPAPFVTPLLPVFWERGEAGRELKIQTAAGLQFAQKELRAKAGERISLTLENPDNMPHNWVLLKPGSVERVGALANILIAEANALSSHYVPTSDDVLCHTRVLDPLKSTTIHFTAPTVAGQYPYVCTFPGHWAVMRGALIVE
jgi:azurin